MKKWAPSFVQSHASPAAKGLMVMLTDLWERSPRRRRKRRFPMRERRIVRHRRPRWHKGGYGIYDLRMLRLFGEWIHRVEEASQ